MLDLTLYHDAVARGHPNPDAFLRPNPFPQQDEDGAYEIAPEPFTFGRLAELLVSGIIAFVAVGGFGYVVMVYH